MSSDFGVVLFANDVDRLTVFYEAVTAFRRVHVEDGLVVLADGGAQLIIHAMPAAIVAQYPIASPPFVREDTAIKPFFRVSSLAEARAVAARHGGALRSPEEEWRARGFRASEAYDPEGNVIQFREDDPLA
jgi:catechol 2,3-dioxygenase-like lactoylglutathione lyase family enzyme